MPPQEHNHSAQDAILSNDILNLKDIIELRFSHITEKLDGIHEQTKKTNGRVTKLEAWRNIIVGAGCMLSIIFTIFKFIYPLF